MHRYEELEKQYYKKKVKIYSVLTFYALILIVGGCYVYNNLIKSSKKTPDLQVKKINLKHESFEKKDLQKKSVSNIKKETKIVKTESKKKKNNESEIPTLTFSLPEIKKQIPVKKTAPQKIIKTQPNKKTMPVIVEKSVNIKDLIKNYKQNPRFDLAMMISKYYYKNGDLNNAKLWALRANNINPKNFESWMMFAKILLKKHDKIKAKEVLKIYLNDYGENEQIIKLLRSIDE